MVDGWQGCGIVEYASREQAQNAVAQLSNQNLMGRLVYVREDREAEPRFSNPSSSRGNFGGPGYGGQQFGGHQAGFQQQQQAGGARQVYVANVSTQPSWMNALTFLTAALQCRLAGPEGPLPPGSFDRVCYSR